MTRSLLCQLRRRLILQAFGHALARAVLLGAGLLLLAVAFQRMSAVRLVTWTGLLSLAAITLALVETWLRRPALERVAAQLDHRAGTRDRLATALAFEQPANPMESAALAECEVWLKMHFDGKRHTPWTLPAAAPWLLAPVLSIAFLQFRPHHAPVASVAAVRGADPTAILTATELERMAGRIDTQTKNRPPGDLQKVADALKRSASQLRKEANGGSAAKATLLELSTLENVLKAALEGSVPETPGDALSKAEDGKQGPEAPKKHDPKVAKKEEEQGKKLVEGKNKERPIKALENTPANAASQQGGQSGSGANASQTAAETRAGNSGGMGQSMGAGQAKQDSGGDGGGGASARELQGMISKLQEMKSGKEGGTASRSQGSGNGESKSEGQMMVDTSARESHTGEQARGAQGAMGQGGSELDQGTKKTPFGKMHPGESAKAGKQVRVTGAAGAGESMRAMIATMPGEEPAKASFKPLYDAAKPAAEDAMIEENIPIGSRLFVKRYFEAIRPK